MAAVKTAETGKDAFDAMNAPAGEARKTRGKKRAGKKRRSASLIVGILIIIVLFIGFAFTVFYFDFFNVRTGFFAFLHGIDPDYRGMTEREAAIAEKTLELSNREQGITAEEDRLKAVESGLSERETAVIQREQIKTPIYRPPVNDEDVVYMKSIGKIYASMDPVAAADIMVRLYSTEDMAAVIYYMTQPEAAAILERMPANTAADITDRLLHE